MPTTSRSASLFSVYSYHRFIIPFDLSLPRTVCQTLWGVPPSSTVSQCRPRLFPPALPPCCMLLVLFIAARAFVGRFFCCLPNLAMKRFMATSSCCRAARLLWLICHYNYLCPRYYIHTRTTERARRRHNMPHHRLATSPAVRHIYRFALRLHFYDESSWLYLRTIWLYQW